MARHTDKTYEAELNELRQNLLTIGGLVEDAITLAVRAVTERKTELADSVIADDRRVNRMEVEIDELCLRLLALRQPAASDLRFITLVLKVVTDLERIGDLAVNIAERAKELNTQPQLKPYIDLPLMSQAAHSMLKDALDSFVAADTNKARDVLRRDDEIDNLYHQIFHELLGYMVKDPTTTTRATAILFISKHLERVADHATNLAEMVIFYVEGRDVRHPHSR